MANVSIIAVCAIWFICILVLLALLLHSYINFGHVMMERQNAKDATLRNNVIEKQKRKPGEASVGKKSPIADNSAIGPSTLDQSKVETATLAQSGRFNHRKNSKSLFSESLKSHILLLALVAGLFIIGTAPIVLILFISAINPYIPKGFATNSVFIFIILFDALCRLTSTNVICSAYSGLSIAVKSLVRSIAQCHCFKSRR